MNNVRITSKEIEEIKNLILIGHYEGFIFPSGLIYKGGIYQGLPHGKGSIILPCGDKYNYEFCKGQLTSSRDILLYPDGSFYEGEVAFDQDAPFINYKPCGKGIIRNADGSTYYEGDWYYDHDPKVVWICGPILWYENGRIFYQKFCLNPPIGADDLLYQGILQQMPSSWDHRPNPVKVMFPHLQRLGVPTEQNYIEIFAWYTDPEKATQFAGYYDLKDYLRWFYIPEHQVMERFQTTIKTIDWIFTVKSWFEGSPKLPKHINKNPSKHLSKISHKNIGRSLSQHISDTPAKNDNCLDLLTEKGPEILKSLSLELLQWKIEEEKELYRSKYPELF